MNIIEELYFGNIDPNTQTFDSHSNYGKAMQIISDTEDELLKLLDGKENQLFRNFIKAQSEINAITGVENL